MASLAGARHCGRDLTWRFSFFSITNERPMHNDALFSVSDQIVLVSGGSRGIGRALAEGFVERGARVIIAGRELGTLEQTASEISRGRHPVTTVVCDVARPADIEAMVEAVIGEHGHIDTLLNVAGVNKRMKVEQ